MKLASFALALLLSFATQPLLAGIEISPFASINSTKTVNPSKKNKGKEDEKIKQRQMVGLRAGVGFYRIMKFQFSLGQSKLTTTEKTQYAVDEFDQIDFKKDLNMSTDEPDKEVKITETQNQAKASLILDPGFWIFIVRAKVGVTATQRIIEKEEVGKDNVKLTPPPKYNPHAGLGFGVRFTPRMYAMAEYNLDFYKFPETEPFSRELAVSYSVSF